MIKLLLLTTLSLSSYPTLFATGLQGSKSAIAVMASFTDSTIKQINLSDPPVENGITANLAVKLNPMAISFVQGYVKSHTLRLTSMKNWGKPYFDMMEGVLTQYNLPAELKYLAVIESQLKSGAVSWAGAVG